MIKHKCLVSALSIQAAGYSIMSDTNKYLAELIGTFVLVFMGCGSAVIAGKEVGFLGIALAFGISVLVMVYAIGPISGCHINPAITIAMLVNGKINGKDAGIYIICQCIGAIIAAALLLVIMTGLPTYNLATNGLGQNGYGAASPAGFSMMSGLIAEVILTFVFLIVIFGATSKAAPAGFAGIAIGLSLAMIHIVGIPITGVSVNPARSLGPAIFAGSTAISQLWLFIIAPIIGAVLAAFVWKYLLEETFSPA
jgi:aquaporin Z